MVDVCQNLSDEQLRLDDTRHLGNQLEAGAADVTAYEAPIRQDIVTCPRKSASISLARRGFRCAKIADTIRDGQTSQQMDWDSSSEVGYVVSFSDADLCTIRIRLQHYYASGR